MGSWITYLAYMLRLLNRQMVEDAKANKADDEKDRAKAEALLERAVTALTQVNITLEALKTKVCDHGRKVDKMAEETDRLRDKVAQCPTRPGGT
jgi:predicted  nucleic acid-binding Zn-ribbon protein